MAGGSQILINDQGITITTHGKIVYQAAQHVFAGGGKAHVELPIMPNTTSQKFSNRLDANTLIAATGIADAVHKTVLSSGRLVTGSLDEHGRTQQLQTSKADDTMRSLVGRKMDEWGGAATEQDQSQNG
jgi:uncharacterized protein (DUF2345 family)